MAAASVSLHNPDSVSPIDGGSGGYLIAEYDTGTVRQVSTVDPSGTFTTVAGTPGQQGFGGDGGAATAALLFHPEGVVSLSGGGFMIADTDNERIREVSPSGTISTVAGNGVATYAGDGGDATAGSLFSPRSVSPLPSGGFLIADGDNNVIRQVTLAATTSFTLSPAAPNGLAGWYVSPVMVQLTATQGAKIRCVLDPTQTPTGADELPSACPFSGKGSAISGSGPHTLWAASVNKFGDEEVPVSVSVTIDMTPPSLACESAIPTFRYGERNAVLTVTLTDMLSGPASEVIKSPVDTTVLGPQTQLITGQNAAGLFNQVDCSYSVFAPRLAPPPALSWRFAAANSGTAVSLLAVTHVPHGARVSVTCGGGGCPFGTLPNVKGAKCSGKSCAHGKRGPRTVDLTSLFAGRTLAAGARLIVRVAKPDTIGRAWLLTLRGGKVTSHRGACLLPGSTMPRAQC
jgi:hypothetical protein